MILIRGLPGSGKSTLAKFLLKVLQTGAGEAVDSYSAVDTHWLEADMFFENPQTGEYKFDPELLKDAHEWCQKSASIGLQSGANVIVSNTFSRIWEMQPYLDMAEEFDVELVVHDLKNAGLSVEALWARGVHSVPVEAIEKMWGRWEDFPVKKDSGSNG